MDTGAEMGGETNWERSIDKYILPWVPLTASGKMLCSIANSARCSVMT